MVDSEFDGRRVTERTHEDSFNIRLAITSFADQVPPACDSPRNIKITVLAGRTRCTSAPSRTGPTPADNVPPSARECDHVGWVPPSGPLVEGVAISSADKKRSRHHRVDDRDHEIPQSGSVAGSRSGFHLPLPTSGDGLHVASRNHQVPYRSASCLLQVTC